VLAGAIILRYEWVSARLHASAVGSAVDRGMDRGRRLCDMFARLLGMADVAMRAPQPAIGARNWASAKWSRSNGTTSMSSNGGCACNGRRARGESHHRRAVAFGPCRSLRGSRRTFRDYRHLRGPLVSYQDDGSPLTEGLVEGFVRRGARKTGGRERERERGREGDSVRGAFALRTTSDTFDDARQTRLANPPSRFALRWTSRRRVACHPKLARE
jgi:hypothetical protein